RPVLNYTSHLVRIRKILSFPSFKAVSSLPYHDTLITSRRYGTFDFSLRKSWRRGGCPMKCNSLEYCPQHEPE
ncbi:MAG: hypothetical protein LUQ37_05200, partial [Methanoregulaceae archaeon]|nr:hypothetical protein [Methanoregulaceae archaeon]